MKKLTLFCLLVFSAAGLSALETEDIFYVVSTGQLQEYRNLKNEVFDINSRDKNGRTLLIAAIYGILEFQHKNSGTTALHEAAKIGDFETVEMLLKNGADAFVTDESGMTPYLLSLKNANTSSSEVILKYLKSGKIRSSENSVTGFIEKNYIPIIEDLLKKKINVNVKDFSGNTAVHYAVQTGLYDIVKVLIDNNANVNILSDSTGKSPLILSSEGGFPDITELLLANKADVNVAYSDAKAADNKNQSGINLAGIQYFEVPQEYNLKIIIHSENKNNPDNDRRCYYKVYIDKVEAGRTSVGLETQNKVFTASVDANRHLLRIEKYDLDESQKKYIQVNNIYQPDPDFIYIETFGDRILKIDVVHTPRNIKSRYEMSFVKKGEL
ncbi:MAG: ankyrin repeat domain-containing protein [Spirochaetes bacterium]|nr:ankyrin repeat domain-containing protein [Spirochaetota bacterium]